MRRAWGMGKEERTMPRVDRVPSTHWDGCWHSLEHHECAVARIEQLTSDVVTVASEHHKRVAERDEATAEFTQLAEERDALRARCTTLEEELTEMRQGLLDDSVRPGYECLQLKGAHSALRRALTELREAREKASALELQLSIRGRYLAQAQADTREARTVARRLYATCKEANLVCGCGRVME